ncbi:MAG: LPXTG cell wall anchor domain-containing protein [Erysipelotrichaceae bacterium]|nr:LPXTG cell wall anchor domain-containing protein [Erysipelotrichaceae bacterium]
MEHGTYTTESYNAYITALNAANEVLSDISATQEEIDNALAVLQTAYDNLTKVTGTDTNTNNSTATEDTINQSSNDTSTSSTTSSKVQTGDNTNALAATILLFTAAGCIVMLRKKKETE